MIVDGNVVRIKKELLENNTTGYSNDLLEKHVIGYEFEAKFFMNLDGGLKTPDTCFIYPKHYNDFILNFHSQKMIDNCAMCSSSVQMTIDIPLKYCEYIRETKWS